MKIYTIYKATNMKNNKSYIGFDANWPNRIQDHVYAAKGQHDNSFFHRALRKYGESSFVWEVIYQSLDGENTLRKMEGHFIKEYNTYHLWENGGYNLTLGGEGTLGLVYTEEMKKKTSETTKLGMKKWWSNLTEEQKQDYILRCTKKPEGYVYPKGVTTHKVSKEARERIRQSRLGKHFSSESKAKLSKSRKGKGTGSRNAMANLETREKQRLACVGRKKAYREDGSWYWSRP